MLLEDIVVEKTGPVCGPGVLEDDFLGRTILEGFPKQPLLLKRKGPCGKRKISKRHLGPKRFPDILGLLGAPYIRS